MTNDKILLDRIEKNNFIFWLVLLLGSVFMKSIPISIGILGGGGIVIINFHWLRNTIEKAFQVERTRKGLLILSFFLKFAFLVSVMSLLLLTTKVNYISFILGISIIIVSISIEAFKYRTS